MSTDLVKLPFNHSKGVRLGIDIFTLEELYERQATLNHRLTEPHRLGFYALLYLTSGRGKHTVDFQAYQVESHALIAISNNQIHQFDPGLPLKGYIVVFTEEFMHRSLFDLEGTLTLQFFDPITTQAYCLGDAESTLPHIERLIEEYQRSDWSREQVPILIRELGILLLKANRLRRDQLSEKDQQAETSPRLLAFRELLQLHIGDHWTAQRYADELGFSKRTLGSLTRKHLNHSPKEIIDQRLLLEIKRLLAHTNSSVKEIAYQLGFEDPSNMTKFFKRKQGNTPKEFRQSVGFTT